MSLRNRLLALSLLTLLLPWSGWKLLQELEQFLRSAQESALLISAQAIADNLPFEPLSRLRYLPKQYIQVQPLARAPEIDGYADDWRDAEPSLRFQSVTGPLLLEMSAASEPGRLYLLVEVHDQNPWPAARPLGKDRFQVLLRSPRAVQRFVLQPEAPGPVKLQGESGDGQAEGYWLETADGFRLELALPVQQQSDLQFSLSYPLAPAGSEQAVIDSTTLIDAPVWLPLVSDWVDVSQSMARSLPAESRGWLVDGQGRVVASAGDELDPSGLATTWAQRLLYRLVAGARTEIRPMPAEPRMRLEEIAVLRALAGERASQWAQDAETAVLRNTVAVPVVDQDEILGAMVLESSSEGLLLVTNRALGRLLMITLILTVGLAGGLWFFATRLSRRVQRLSGAVSVAMDQGIGTGTLPLVDDRDELGALARNNEALLRAVADYNQYLQTLAGKLSHELKTPLAIARSSLENLASRPLDADGQRFLQRAREGIERQAAIVRAMSEASRLEAAIEVAEWEQVDLRELLQACVGGYRNAHPQRRIELADDAAQDSRVMLRCAPELLAQALDKLVDNAVSLSGSEDIVSLSLQADSQQCTIAVRNTGSRLPDDFQGRLFDSLVSLRQAGSQSDAGPGPNQDTMEGTRENKTPHLGLGLYIVKLVAAAHGGSATARNLPGNGGVEFALRIPRERA